MENPQLDAAQLMTIATRNTPVLAKRYVILHEAAKNFKGVLRDNLSFDGGNNGWNAKLNLETLSSGEKKGSREVFFAESPPTVGSPPRELAGLYQSNEPLGLLQREMGERAYANFLGILYQLNRGGAVVYHPFGSKQEYLMMVTPERDEKTEAVKFKISPVLDIPPQNQTDKLPQELTDDARGNFYPALLRLDEKLFAPQPKVGVATRLLQVPDMMAKRTYEGLGLPYQTGGAAVDYQKALETALRGEITAAKKT